MTAAARSEAPPAAQLRPASKVMRLARMGAAFPTRLSFLPTLFRALAGARVQVARVAWRIDDACVGHAVYSLEIGGRRYSLVAFSSPLPPERRLDRVIAEAWDTTFVLYDGAPDAAEIARLAASAPKQEASRYTERELILSRANRSGRLFDAVVEALAEGRQPDPARLDAVGYLLRTTAVYGNGKFGIADREALRGRDVLDGPFGAEMLTVWLIRGFSLDLVEHAARVAAPETAAPLSRDSRRRLGVGNATGLGMAPFLVSHPALIHRWVAARETALACARARAELSCEEAARAADLFDRVIAHVEGWRVDDAEQSARIAVLRREIAEAAGTFRRLAAARYPLAALIDASAAWSLETQELLVALALEVIGAEVDTLTETMGGDDPPRLDAGMTVNALKTLVEAAYAWAARDAFAAPPHIFWYVSEQKLEPRIGRCGRDVGEGVATPLDIGRQAAALRLDLRAASEDETVASFLRDHPEHRRVVRRVQWLAGRSYAEIQDDLVGADCRPIDLLRFKLAFFGASHFDPKSDQWTRITLARGAPEFDDVACGCGADWSPLFGAPSLERAAQDA